MTDELAQQKAALREKIWATLEKARVGRFPLPLKGRIPNFEGAERAAKQLTQLPEWKAARVILTNPDSAQRPVRELGLVEGKRVIMASPRLKKGYLELRPEKGKQRAASTIKGAFKFGKQIAAERMPRPDLIITGCVAVDKRGWRLGKGGGYGDIEIGTAHKRFGRIPVVTTVHSLQVVAAVPHGPGDTNCDIIVTPEKIIRTSQHK